MFDKILKLAKAYEKYAKQKLKPYHISDAERNILYSITNNAIEDFFAIPKEKRLIGRLVYEQLIRVRVEDQIKVLPIRFIIGDDFYGYYQVDEEDEPDMVVINIDSQLDDAKYGFSIISSILAHEYTHVYQTKDTFERYMSSILEDFIEKVSGGVDRVHTWNEIFHVTKLKFPEYADQLSKYKDAFIDLPLTELSNLQWKSYYSAGNEREAFENEVLEYILHKMWKQFALAYIQSDFSKQRMKEIVEIVVIDHEYDLTKEQIARIANKAINYLEQQGVIDQLLNQ